MRIIRNVLLLVICCFLYVPSALAQNGAFIERGEMQTFFAEWDGDIFVAYANSQGLDFFCGLDTEPVEGEWKLIDQPNGKFKYNSTGDYFIQVYYQLSPDDFFNDYCEYWENGPIIAEGIVHFAGNTVGHTISGTLYDLTDNCTSGMVDLNIIRRWRWDKKLNDYVQQVWKGPRLSCMD